ncbi:ABC transporter substrate-binding protein [Micromonospora sp. HM5-17]|uniref:ABC transporter substrate-binding protein n=1 Tax=Micromonospora sp. HM5-17 TaxID=2487710 RepID=UPI001F45DB7D|nr:ABC transporter substrate-binding protein [Micromonospora sp. HM5-17]
MTRTRWATAFGAAVALALAGCGGTNGGSGDDPIVVGISLPLTGDFSEPGKGVQRGYEAWAKITNDKGGLLGRRIELKILDDQSNADRVVADYEQLIGKDNVDIVVGPFSTRLVVPAARVAEEYGMLFVEPAGAAKIAASRADIAVGGSQYQDGVNLIVALQQLDYQPKLAAFSTAPTNPEFAAAIGNKTEGILAPTGYTQKAPYPSNVEFVEKYTAQFGSPPEEDEANAYTTGQVVAAAVTAVGCAEQGECQKKLVDWLRNNTVDTVVGPLRWDAAGRPQGAHMIQQWVGGQIQIVLPADAREADLIYPKPAW